MNSPESSIKSYTSWQIITTFFDVQKTERKKFTDTVGRMSILNIKSEAMNNSVGPDCWIQQCPHCPWGAQRDFDYVLQWVWSGE